MSIVGKEIRKNANSESIKEKEKRRMELKSIGLVNSCNVSCYATHLIIFFCFQKDLRKMNEDDVSEWLMLGLGITDGLDSLKVDGKAITQMSIRDLKAHMPMESALKVNRAITKASERDLMEFDPKCAEVLRAEDELRSVEGFFKVEEMSTESAEESVASAFGEEFIGRLQQLRSYVKKKYWPNLQKELNLNDDEMMIYELFLTGLGRYEYCPSKVFNPFISRIPGNFLRSRDFILRLLSVLRKLPGFEEGTYNVWSRKSAEFFKVGETYVVPSFALGTVSEEW